MQTLTFLRALGCALLCQVTLAAHADPLSYARYDQVRTRDLQLDLKADFKQKTLSGYAELSLNWIDPAARTLVLDTRDLSIAKVQVQDKRGAWQMAPYQLDKADPEKGQALRITTTGQPGKVRVYYHTAPNAIALQWLTPQQTMSGKLPFMFSQSQSINARSWVPSQDTPAVRFTYSARIDAPSGHARRDERRERRKGDGQGRLEIQDAAADSILPAGHCHRRAGSAQTRSPLRRVCRTAAHQGGRIRAGRHGKDDPGRRSAVRPVWMGTLRHDRAAAIVPLRRHGKPAPDLPHADHDRGRPQPGRPDRA